MASFRGQMNDDELMTFPPIFQAFRSGGYIDPNMFVEQREITASFLALTIHAIEKDKEVTGKV